MTRISKTIFRYFTLDVEVVFLNQHKPNLDQCEGASTLTGRRSKAFSWVSVGQRSAVSVSDSLPAALLGAAVELRLSARKQPVCARMIQQEPDGGFDVLDEVRRFCVRGRGQKL